MKRCALDCIQLLNFSAHALFRRLAQKCCRAVSTSAHSASVVVDVTRVASAIILGPLLNK